MVVSTKGVVIAASNLGKWKTATTMTAICGLLVAATLPAGGIASTINLFNIDLVILGYDGVLLPERYLNLLERKINGRIFYSDTMRVVVKKPYYGQDAQLLGGACNILQAVFDGELLPD